MRHLGALDGPVLAFGGPCSNLEATAAVLAEAHSLGIPPARTVCTGDVVAYCADPRATVELVRQSGISVVLGNVEDSLASAASDCGCGFDPGSACDLLAAQWYRFASDALDAGARAWMASLPRALRFELAGRTLHVVHGAPSDISRYLFASTAGDGAAAELDAVGGDGIVAGHCGLPFTRLLGGRLWHNAGVIGVPANDGTPRVWYSLLTPREEGMVIEHRALEYDHARAARKMRARGLPEGYAAALETGLWPSLEVLPARESAAQGVALAPRSTFWPA